MADNTLFNVRPLEGTSDTLDGAFRVHLHPDDLKALQLSVGDACLLRNQQGVEGVGVAWRSPTANTRRIAKISHTLKDAYGFSLGDKISILRHSALPIAKRVWVRPLSSLQQEDLDLYVFLAQHVLYSLEGLWAGGHFDTTIRHPRPAKARFVINKIEGHGAGSGAVKLWSFRHDSKVAITLQPDDKVNGETSKTPEASLQAVKSVDFTGIGGLDKQMERLANEIAYVQEVIRDSKTFTHYLHDDPPSRVLLHGASGTGKSLVLSKIKDAPFQRVLRIGHPARSSIKISESISQTFKEALLHQPSAILIDNLDGLATKGADTAAGAALCSEIDNLGSASVTIIAAAQKPNDIEAKLRPYFDCEVELPIPTIDARLDILKAFRQPASTTPSDSLLQEVASRTHGFVGRDLRQLCREADRLAWTRHHSNLNVKPDASTNPGTTSTRDNSGTKTESVTLDDFVAALKRVRPTAMREVFFEVPRVSWDDIGGSESVKSALWRVVDLPFKHPDIMAQSPYIPPRGILLYGPPGCSKTLTAKAIASSSGLNFISVKGAELTSMYVGETERAIREVFRKAQAAAPSVIFFDEIDAIAAARDSGHGTPGLNIVTTLLTEMDGMQALRDVLILAATNRPDVLDPALLRPGRFDTVLYVPPPPLHARKQILAIHTKHPAFGPLDLDLLAEQTEGFSGAEIVEVCNLAVGAWTERQVRGKSGLTGNSIGDDKVSPADFEDALAKVHKVITPEMLAEYGQWAAQRGAVAQL